jgi:hypothetical protein
MKYKEICTRQTSALQMKKALPLAGGLGGYRAAREIFSYEIKPKAKYNKIEKNPPRRILFY